MAHKIMILHDEAERGIALDLFFTLREHGIVAWLPDGPPVGRTAEPLAFDDALAETRGIVVLTSTRTGASLPLAAQIDAASASGKPVIAPILYEGESESQPAQATQSWSLGADTSARKGVMDQLSAHLAAIAFDRVALNSDPPPRRITKRARVVAAVSLGLLVLTVALVVAAFVVPTDPREQAELPLASKPARPATNSVPISATAPTTTSALPCVGKNDTAASSLFDNCDQQNAWFNQAATSSSGQQAPDTGQ
jgi:hypothetical protein